MNLSTFIMAPALNLFETQLEIFATSVEYQSSMILSFGEGHDYTALQEIFLDSTGVLAQIEVVPLASLNGAYGAFSRDTNKIYLASEYINSANPSAIADVLLEEYGHYIDAQLNSVETVGDEGEIFADLVQGNLINPAAFTEDDTRSININSNWITIEQAQGDLDLSFGSGTGVAVSPYTSSTTGGIVVQADGKILVTATINRELGVIRFNSDGTLDLTFGGGDGLVTINISSSEPSHVPYSIALQTDGKILIAGEESVTATLIRLNNDGTLDTSFDGDGIVTYDVSVASFFDKVVMGTDGKIVVAGTLVTFFPGLSPPREVVRYNLDGSLDPSFNADYAGDNLVVQTDGRIITSYDDGLFRRLNLDGSLDLSWGDDGRVSLSEETNIRNVNLNSIALQTDGKLLTAGSIEVDDINYPIFVRFNPDGTLDPSFGSNEDGISSPRSVFDSSLSTNDPIKGLTLQADGKFLVTVELDNGSIVLARFDSDGSQDFTFGSNGILTTPVTNDEDENLVLQPNGQILVAGTNNGFVSVVRYVGFESDQYGASYPDLITGIGYNLEALTQHYFNAGVFEGRSPDDFDEYRYIASNADLIGAFGLNGPGATYHYITSGYFEGRSLTGFIPSRYINSHADLLNAFGTNTLAATQHYITNGVTEGRDPNLFLADRYIASHGDLIQVFGYNLEAGSNHYLFSGRSEGRQITFSPETYLNRYADLQQAFGTDLNAATAHYITNGFAEGRTWM